MLFLEQTRRRPTWSSRATWCHVGDPCSNAL